MRPRNSGARKVSFSAVEGESRIDRVDIALILLFADHVQRLTETLIVDDLALAQEADDIAHVGIVNELEDVVIGDTRLLLSCHILRKIGDRVTDRLDGRGGKGHTVCGGRIDTDRMVDKIGIQPGIDDLLRREPAGELFYKLAHHLHMRELIRSLMMELIKPKDVKPMKPLGHLEQMLMNGEITEEEYKKKKAWYVETLLELYIKDIITEEELKEKLNK